MTSHLQLQARLEDTSIPPNNHRDLLELCHMAKDDSLSDSRSNTYSHKELLSKASVTAASTLRASGDTPALHWHFPLLQQNGRNLDLSHFHDPGYMEDSLT